MFLLKRAPRIKYSTGHLLLSVYEVKKFHLPNGNYYEEEKMGTFSLRSF